MGLIVGVSFISLTRRDRNGPNRVNLLTPMSDQDRISPYNISTTSVHVSTISVQYQYNISTISYRQVMRINTDINERIISLSKTKFSKLTS